MYRSSTIFCLTICLFSICIWIVTSFKLFIPDCSDIAGKGRNISYRSKLTHVLDNTYYIHHKTADPTTHVETLHYNIILNTKIMKHIGNAYPTCKDWPFANDYKFLKYISKKIKNQLSFQREITLEFDPHLYKCLFNYDANYLSSVMMSKYCENFIKINVSQNARYISIFSSGVGPAYFKTLDNTFCRKERSIYHHFILAEGDLAARIYRPETDVILPGHSHFEILKKKPSQLQSKFWFRGLIYSEIRDEKGILITPEPINILRSCLVEKFHIKNAREKIPQKELQIEMSHSKFCFIPRGNTPWTRRLFDAILSLCLPVIFSNTIVLPLSSVINWKKISIKLPESWILNKTGEIHKILNSINDTEYSRYIGELHRVASLLSRGFEEIVYNELIEKVIVNNNVNHRSIIEFWSSPIHVFNSPYPPVENEYRQVGYSYTYGGRGIADGLYEGPGVSDGCRNGI